MAPPVSPNAFPPRYDGFIFQTGTHGASRSQSTHYKRTLTNTSEPSLRFLCGRETHTLYPAPYTGRVTCCSPARSKQTRTEMHAMQNACYVNQNPAHFTYAGVHSHQGHGAPNSRVYKTLSSAPKN